MLHCLFIFLITRPMCAEILPWLWYVLSGIDRTLSYYETEGEFLICLSWASPWSENDKHSRDPRYGAVWSLFISEIFPSGWTVHFPCWIIASEICFVHCLAREAGRGSEEAGKGPKLWIWLGVSGNPNTRQNMEQITILAEVQMVLELTFCQGSFPCRKARIQWRDWLERILFYFIFFKVCV